MWLSHIMASNVESNKRRRLNREGSMTAILGRERKNDDEKHTWFVAKCKW